MTELYDTANRSRRGVVVTDIGSLSLRSRRWESRVFVVVQRISLQASSVLAFSASRRKRRNWPRSFVGIKLISFRSEEFVRWCDRVCESRVTFFSSSFLSPRVSALIAFVP